MGKSAFMKREKQLIFSKFEEASMRVFGGSYLRGNAKIKRPITTKRAMHLVMASSIARGPMSMLRFREPIERTIYKQANKLGVKVYRLANAGNHLHLLILPHSRKALHSFLRSISGLIARIVTGAQRGSSKKLRFWTARPFTRIVEWGRDFRGVCNYLLQNTLEALGFIEYKERKVKGKTLRGNRPYIDVS
jgi:REP element-mobilizing transposase RayT